MEKGGQGHEHRDTGRQRSEPEEGKHAQRPEGRAGGRKSRPLERPGAGKRQKDDQCWSAGGRAARAEPLT